MQRILNHLDLPAEVVSVFYNVYEKISDTAEYKEISQMLKDGKDMELVKEKSTEYAEKAGVHTYQYYMVVLISNAYIARDRFVEKFDDEKLFWDNILDFKYKINECKNRYGVWGIMPFVWYNHLYTANIFTFERLEFVPTINGEKKQKVLNVHIPSSGPLTHESVIASYKKAYDFFKETHGDRMIILCNSYLLLPDYIGTVFKEGSNTYKFVSDFAVLKTVYINTFNQAWRIFNVDYTGDVSVLPQKTSMQKAFVKYLANGGKSGFSLGGFIFDGEKIYKDKEELKEKLCLE